ncbi:hypothetical protein EC988_001597 [Linderina pennispora]|nr:hypothetical protein EC988_001597 [Linderina pennispora]
MGPRIFEKLYFHVQCLSETVPNLHSTLAATEAGMANGGATASPAMPRFHLQTNSDIIPFMFQPRTIILRVDGASALGTGLRDFLTRRVFVNRPWPSVQTVRIDMSLKRGVGNGADMSHMAQSIHSLLSVTPNLRALSLSVCNAGELRLDIGAVVRSHAHQIAALDVNCLTTADYSRLLFPALKDFSIWYREFEDLVSGSCMDISLLTNIKFHTIKPNELFRLFERASDRYSATFPNLETLSITFGVSSAEDAAIPDTSKKVLYSFPKLHSLYLRCDGGESPEVYWMFKDAPLERLHLVARIKFLQQLNMSDFPRLAHVQVSFNRKAGEVDPQYILGNLVSPVSNLRRLEFGVDWSLLCAAWRFGCVQLRSLSIGHHFTPNELQNILQQLPELVTLNIEYYLTHREGNASMSDMQSAVLGSDLSVVNRSLQALTVTDKYFYRKADLFSDQAVALVEMATHLPSLLKVVIVCDRPRARNQLIKDAFEDCAIQERAKHFANVSVYLNFC